MQRFLRSLAQKHRATLFAELKDKRLLRRTWTANLVVAYFVAALVHGTTLTLVVAGGWSIASAWPSWWGLLGAAVCWILAWALFPRWAEKPGDTLAEMEFPALYATVRRIAAAVMSRPVAHVVVNEEWQASYSEVGFRRRPCLALGLPLVTALTAEEFVALVAHEAAHGANQDLRRNFVLGGAQHTMERWWIWLEPDEIWPVGATLGQVLGLAVTFGLAQIPRAIAMVLLVLSYRDSQRAEYLADHLAARVSGSAAAIRLMEKLRLTSIFELTVQRLALREPRGHSLLEPLRDAFGAVPERECARLARVDRHRELVPDYTHPPNHLRIAMHEAHPLPESLTLSPAEYESVGEELGKLELRIHRKLVDQYLSEIS